MNYPSSGALFDSWVSFVLIDSNEDSEAVLCCEDIKQTEIFLEVFLDHFQSKQWLRNAKLKKRNATHTKLVGRSEVDKILLTKPFVRNLKTERVVNDTFTYSLANKSKTYKGMDDQMYTMMKEILANGIDLGDSRNFESAEQLNEKFIAILNCKMHLGTESSWTMFAKYLRIPVLHTFQLWPYQSLKRVRFNDVRTYVDPHIEIPDAPQGRVFS
tara:strand:- start:143 stop:784 length:642 start_codon:yes stop_codon:yes gene_type:complete